MRGPWRPRPLGLLAGTADSPGHSNGWGELGGYYREFASLAWWSEARTGQRVLGGVIGLVAAAAVAGAAVLAGRSLGAGLLLTRGLGASVFLHETAWAIQTAISLPDPVLSNRERRIRRAEEELFTWRADREASFPYAEFFKESEYERWRSSPSERILSDRQWEATIGRVRQAAGNSADPRVQARDVILQLRQDWRLADYYRDNPSMMRMLEQEGGNCEARARLILSSLTEAGIHFQEPEVLGVQLFKDHIQIVVYNRETHEVLDLLTGRRERRPSGPIYEPAIFLYAFLREEGREPPVGAEELLIARGEGPRSSVLPDNLAALQRIFGGDSGFPSVDQVYSREPIPERSVTLPPQSDAPPSDDEMDSSASLGTDPPSGILPGVEGPPDLRTITAFSLEEAMADHSQEPGARAIFQQAFSLSSRSFFLSGLASSSSLVFRESRHARAFNALRFSEDRMMFLFARMNEDLVRHFESRQMRHLMGLLEDPDRLRGYLSADIDTDNMAYAGLREDIERLLRIQQLATRSSIEELGQRLARQYQVSPQLRSFREALRRFDEELRDDPATMIERLEILDPPDRLSALYNLRKFREEEPSLLEPLARWVQNAPLGGPSRRNVSPIEIRLPAAASSGEIDLVLPPLESPPAGGPLFQAIPARQRPNSISEETLIQLILLMPVEDTALFRRWTPELSRRFRELNRSRGYVYDSYFSISAFNQSLNDPGERPDLEVLRREIEARERRRDAPLISH